MFGGSSSTGGEMFCQTPTSPESLLQSTGGDWEGGLPACPPPPLPALAPALPPCAWPAALVPPTALPACPPLGLVEPALPAWRAPPVPLAPAPGSGVSCRSPHATNE